MCCNLLLPTSQVEVYNSRIIVILIIVIIVIFETIILLDINIPTKDEQTIVFDTSEAIYVEVVAQEVGLKQ